MFHSAPKIYRYVLYSFFTLSCLYNSTVNASPLYVEVDVMRTSISVESTNFVILQPKLKLGYIFTPQVMFELQYAGSGDDLKDNSTMNLSSISAAYLRLGSPASSVIRAYIVLGYANTNLEVTGQSGIADNYDGFSGGLILEYSSWSKSNFVTVEYDSFYYNDDVSVSAFSLGYRYVF